MGGGGGGGEDDEEDDDDEDEAVGPLQREVAEIETVL